MDKHQHHKGETPHGRKFRMSNGTLTLDPFKNKPGESHRILPYQDHKLYLALTEGRGKTRYLYPPHRWHLLSSIYTGKVPTEILAATSDDGIAVVVRWVYANNMWRVWAIDTENCAWEEITDWTQETVVTRTPPHVFDDNVDYYQ